MEDDKTKVRFEK